MDGEKGEFQALGGSLALDQKGEFQALRGTLSLDLSACKLRNPLPATSTATNNGKFSFVGFSWVSLRLGAPFVGWPGRFWDSSATTRGSSS